MLGERVELVMLHREEDLSGRDLSRSGGKSIPLLANNPSNSVILYALSSIIKLVSLLTLS